MRPVSALDSEAVSLQPPGMLRFVGLAVSMVMVWSVAVTAAPVKTETFGGWRYLAPAKYTATKAANHVDFQKVTAPTFCAIALFQIRPRVDALAVEVTTEWATVIEKNFTATNTRRALPAKTRRGISYHATSANVVDGDGNAFVATNYVVAPQGMVGSVLVTSSTPASLKKCEPATKAFIESLAFDAASAPQGDPEATPPSPVGRWGGASDDGKAGTTVREYALEAKGTYRFRGQQAGGKLKPDQWREVLETGSYTVSGNQLTLMPSTGTTTLFTGGNPKLPARLPLERVTYTWSKQYDAKANSWVLLLTPPAKTKRDGEFTPTAKFESTYVYSDAYKPAWKDVAPPEPEPDADE